MNITIDSSKKSAISKAPARLLGDYLKLKIYADDSPSIRIRNSQSEEIWNVSRRQFYNNLNGFSKFGLAKVTWTSTLNPTVEVKFEV